MYLTQSSAAQALDLTGNMWRMAHERPRRRSSDSSAQASSAEPPKPVRGDAAATAAADMTQPRQPVSAPSWAPGWLSANRPVRPRLEPQLPAACVRPSPSMFSLRTPGPKAAASGRRGVKSQPEACTGVPCNFYARSTCCLLPLTPFRCGAGPSAQIRGP